MIEIRRNTGKFVSRFVGSDRFIQLLTRHKCEFSDTFLTCHYNTTTLPYLATVLL
jgi:hypothetical protein